MTAPGPGPKFSGPWSLAPLEGSAQLHGDTCAALALLGRRTCSQFELLFGISRRNKCDGEDDGEYGGECDADYGEEHDGEYDGG